jgi:hypothetical protein
MALVSSAQLVLLPAQPTTACSSQDEVRTRIAAGVQVRDASHNK